MPLELVPLLAIQRELYGLPRGRERFEAYLKTMVLDGGADVIPPLVALNPMGKEHCAARLDAYLALGAEALAQETLAALADELTILPEPLRLSLALVDDARGGWTNRWTNELAWRQLGPGPYRQSWLTVPLWTSTEPSARGVVEEVRQVALRVASVHRAGRAAETLGELLAQEGAVMARAGCTAPTLDPDDLAYTREVLAPLQNATGVPVLLPALFGDTAARELGYRPLGLSECAGLALALADAAQS